MKMCFAVVMLSAIGCAVLPKTDIVNREMAYIFPYGEMEYDGGEEGIDSAFLVQSSAVIKRDCIGRCEVEVVIADSCREMFKPRELRVLVVGSDRILRADVNGCTRIDSMGISSYGGLKIRGTSLGGQ